MIEETEQETKDLMLKSIISFEKKLQRIRTGRANPSILEQIEVDYYGTNTPINQMSNISIEDARTLTICLLYTSPSPRDKRQSRMPSSA